MTEYSLKQLKRLIGAKIPSGAVPAAWWVTTDQQQIDAFDRWVADYEAHREKVEALAVTIGLTANDAYCTSWGTSSHVTGFRVPAFIGHWNKDHPEYLPVPEGWRIDKKAARLVPSRRTKADRESEASRDFAAVKQLPAVRAYMSGMPTEMWFPGVIYSIQYRRGDNCVWAYSGGDPDRLVGNDRVRIDAAVWHRQKLSTLVALREDAA